MYTNKEIYFALKLIHDICKQNSDCRNCPFYSKEGCTVDSQKEPANWELIPPPEPIEWRPFE